MSAGNEGKLMLNKDRIQQHLNERLTELRAQVANIETDLQQPLDDDFAEQAVDREDDEALDAVEQTALAEIALITLALQRLEAGTYGICTACGNAIAPKRLDAMPEAALCIGCAR